MFNKRKAADEEYCRKKIMDNIKNIKYVDEEVMWNIFTTDLWSYDFFNKASKDEKIIDTIKTLPLAIQTPIVMNLVTFNGELITKFDKSFLSSVDIANAAIGPNLKVPLPTKVETRIAGGIEIPTRTVPDYSAMSDCYHLFDLFPDEVKIEILSNPIRYPYGPDEYRKLPEETLDKILEKMPENVKNDPSLAIDVCYANPQAYKHLSEEVKNNMRVLSVMIQKNSSSYAKEALGKLTPEKQKELVERLIELNAPLSIVNPKEEMKFVYSNKEWIEKIISHSKIYDSALEFMDPELLKDTDFAEKVLSSLVLKSEKSVELALKKFPEGFFNDIDNFNALHFSLGNDPQKGEKLKGILQTLDTDVYIEALKAHPKLMGVIKREDDDKVYSEIINGLSQKDVYTFYKKMCKQGMDISRQCKLDMFVKDPENMYKTVSNMDSEFFIEAIIKNENIVRYINEETLKNEMIIASITLKYMKTKFPKITSEENLDNVIKAVKESIKTTQKDNNIAPRKEPKKKDESKSR